MPAPGSHFRSLRWAGLSRRRRDAALGFSLLELLIVLAVLTLLVAVAFPRYQQARSGALISSLVAELVGNAKACAVLNASGIGEPPSPPPVNPERGGVQITAGCTGPDQGATLRASWGTARASDIPCLDSRSLISSSTATVTVASAGSTLTCTFAD